MHQDANLESMNVIRTTVTLDKTVHQQLSAQALSLGMSLSDVINRKLKNKNFLRTQSAVDDGDAIFSRLAKKAGKTDWAKLVGEERHRDE